jgi:hypothetical protein
MCGVCHCNSGRRLKIVAPLSSRRKVSLESVALRGHLRKRLRVSGERIREGDQALPSSITVGTEQTGTVQQ